MLDRAFPVSLPEVVLYRPFGIEASGRRSTDGAEGIVGAFVPVGDCVHDAKANAMITEIAVARLAQTADVAAAHQERTELLIAVFSLRLRECGLPLSLSVPRRSRQDLGPDDYTEPGSG